MRLTNSLLIILIIVIVIGFFHDDIMLLLYDYGVLTCMDNGLRIDNQYCRKLGYF